MVIYIIQLSTLNLLIRMQNGLLDPEDGDVTECRNVGSYLLVDTA